MLEWLIGVGLGIAAAALAVWVVKGLRETSKALDEIARIVEGD